MNLYDPSYAIFVSYKYRCCPRNVVQHSSGALGAHHKDRCRKRIAVRGFGRDYTCLQYAFDRTTTPRIHYMAIGATVKLEELFITT